jgi:hypothetical protein
VEQIVAEQREKPALDLIEEATYLVRNAPAAALAAYYIGTLPFVLAFLFFWADMGRSATAGDHLAPAALGVAILYVWMSVWQAVFAQRLRSVLTGTPPAPFFRLSLVQSSLQPAKLIVIPIAALLMVPFASIFAFFQSLMAVSYEGAPGISKAYAAARSQSRLWRRQSWLVPCIVAAIAIAVFLNVGVLILIVPQLLKSFLGIDTPLTRSMALPFNSTFLAITAALTYALVDPLVKAIYVLRCFYGESLATGEDLKAQLKAIAAALALMIGLFGASAVYAQPASPAPAASGPPVQGLNRSIDDVLKHPKFSWRLPAARQTSQPKNWFVRQFDSILETINRWVDDFLNWLRDRFRSNRQSNPDKRGLPAMRFWFFVLLGAAVAIAATLLIRSFRKKSRAMTAARPVTVAVPDLASDRTTADQLPADEWLRTARECIARNELRLAVRALYLSNLAYLGARSLLAIDRAKSNLDYARELRRRARTKPEILPVFADTVGVYERSWYGMYDVDREMVGRVEMNLSSMRARLEQGVS